MLVDRAAAAQEARLRLPARLESVSVVRRFVADVLRRWGYERLFDDVALVATEMATNATLHSGSSHFEVELNIEGEAVRVAVRDHGTTPARTIAGRAAIAAARSLDMATTTGRGLVLVSSIAEAWGLEDLADGMRAWATFASGRTGDAPRGPLISGRAPEVDTPTEDGPEVRLIELRGCPPELLLAHDDNLAEVARELRLFGASHRDNATAKVAEQIFEVVRLSAVSWDAARLIAQQGVVDRRTTVDVLIAARVDDLPQRVAVLRRAMTSAESMMADGLLMTLPAPAAVQAWRDWVQEQMVGQATAALEPVPFSDWLKTNP